MECNRGCTEIDRSSKMIISVFYVDVVSDVVVMEWSGRTKTRHSEHEQKLHNRAPTGAVISGLVSDQYQSYEKCPFL